MPSKHEEDVPVKFMVSAIAQYGIDFDRISLCAEERHIDLIRGTLYEGRDDPRGYGKLCGQLIDDFKDIDIYDWVHELNFGPWPAAFGNQIANEAEPYFQIAYFFENAAPISAWAWVWMPTFSRQPSILRETLKALGSAFNRAPNLFEHFITGKLDLPSGIEISTPSFITRHPYPHAYGSVPSTADSVVPIEPVRGRPGTHKKYDDAKLRAVYFDLQKTRKFRSLLEAEIALTESCREKGIKCPPIGSLRKRIARWQKQSAA